MGTTTTKRSSLSLFTWVDLLWWCSFSQTRWSAAILTLVCFPVSFMEHCSLSNLPFGYHMNDGDRDLSSILANQTTNQSSPMSLYFIQFKIHLQPSHQAIYSHSSWAQFGAKFQGLSVYIEMGKSKRTILRPQREIHGLNVLLKMYIFNKINVSHCWNDENRVRQFSLCKECWSRIRDLIFCQRLGHRPSTRNIFVSCNFCSFFVRICCIRCWVVACNWVSLVKVINVDNTRVVHWKKREILCLWIWKSGINHVSPRVKPPPNLDQDRFVRVSSGYANQPKGDHLTGARCRLKIKIRFW